MHIENIMTRADVNQVTVTLIDIFYDLLENFNCSSLQIIIEYIVP